MTQVETKMTKEVLEKARETATPYPAPEGEQKKDPRNQSGGLLTDEQWVEVMSDMDDMESGTLGESKIKIINLGSDDDETEPIKEYPLFVFYRFPLKSREYVKYRKKGISVLHGDFLFRIPNIQDTIDLANMKAQLRGALPEQSFDPSEVLTINAKAHMMILMKECPKWFNLDETYDRNLLLEIWLRVRERERYFRGDVS